MDDVQQTGQWKQDREQMVREQLAGRDIGNPRVLAAFRAVPRHEFVPPASRQWAYADYPLPLAAGQTISQPYVVALMSQLLDLTGSERVLEVGTGSGYQTAILARLAAQVYSVERLPDLSRAAAETLARLGVSNVKLRVGDGSLGWPQHAPFDAIVVTAAAPALPPPLLAQLTAGGRLVLPVGRPFDQHLQRWRRRGEGWHAETLAAVAFVPLVGRHGWPDTPDSEA